MPATYVQCVYTFFWPVYEVYKPVGHLKNRLETPYSLQKHLALWRACRDALLFGALLGLLACDIFSERLTELRAAHFGNAGLATV